MKILINIFFLFNILLANKNNNNLCFYINKNNYIKQGNLIIEKNDLNSQFIFVYNKIITLEKNFNNNKKNIKKFLLLLKKFDKILDKLKIKNINKIKNQNIINYKINNKMLLKLYNKMSNIGNIKYFCYIESNITKYHLIFKINNIKQNIKNLEKILNNKNKLSKKEIISIKNNLIYIKEIIFYK